MTLRALEHVAAGSTGGLRVLHTGTEEGLLINGGLEDQSSGYSANLPFHYTFSSAPRQIGPEVYAELGLMTGAVDPMMAFPAGTVFTPFSVARNVSAEPVSVTPHLYWMQGASARSARLAPFSLLPFRAETLDLPSMLLTAGLSAFNGSVNLILEAQGQPRSLLLASGSVDQKNTYVFQVLPRGVQESAAKTVSYWSTGNGDDTMVTIWNPADEAQDYRFTLFFAGGHYRLPIHLEARATRVFNISETIQNQIPDEDGNIIPASVHEGSAKIAGVHADNEDILVALDAGTYNVRKATCSYYCISCDGEILAYVVITPFSMAKGSTNQLSFTDKWNTGSQFSTTGTWTSSQTSVATVSSTNNGYNGLVTGVSPGTVNFTASGFGNVYISSYCNYDPSCPYNSSFQGSGGGSVKPTVTLSCDTTHLTLGTTDFPGTKSGSCTTTSSPPGGTFGWTVNTSAVTFSANGNSATYSSNAESSTQGDTVVKVTYTVNSQSASGSSQGITVHKPTSLKTVSTVPNDHTTTCTVPCLLNPGKGTCTIKAGTSCNYTEPITRRRYSVVDKWGNLFQNVQLSGVTITESVTASQGSCGGNKVETGRTGGSPFYDDFGKCDSCCEAGGPGCTSTATQTLYANGFSVRNENITVTCTSATLNP